MQILTLLLIALLTLTEVDIFIPSFPQIQELFNLTPFMVELTLGVNFAAYCIGGLFAANLGDRYGRKPIIIGGLIIFVVGSVLCANVTQYWMMLVGRMLQGLGISGPSILAYVVIADNYPPEDQPRILGLFNGFVTIGMALAPSLGSYLTLFLGWRSNFTALLILGIICMVSSALFIPHKRGDHRVSLSLKSYKPVLASPKCLMFVASVTLFIIPYWIYIGMAPILYMQDLGVTLEYFGFYQGAMAGVYAILSFTSGFFINRFGPKNCLCFSIGLYMITACLLGMMSIVEVNSPVLITVVAAMSALALVFPITILWPLSLETVEGAKARIGGVFNAVRMIFCAVGLQISSYFYNGTFKSIAFTMFICLMVGLWVTIRLMRKEITFSETMSSLRESMPSAQ